ncbi:PLP-dependent aminotransferase family protein [Crenobacter cavernae]|uniref:Putative 8-amino-7-oxononanoate synthase n=1 Tax=Crenobacter cavernae TaxID=2290923 RepID=A0ABY0FB31_9NEIS|nr:PLP-dependent aminotransferase family protein [Crenobacter cavernae]RXZ42786.1 PLP-dependent aminotransferase family protein [Crenobacter cavernae]
MLTDLLLQKLESDTPLPKNRQLYLLLRGLILDGTLKAGSRLPTTRELARDLGLSRNTVMYAFEQLLAEGYVTARTGSGTYVADTRPEDSMRVEGSAKVEHGGGEGGRLSTRGGRLIEQAGALSVQWGAFVPGVPDVTAFPYRTWARIQNKVWRRPGPQWLTYGQSGGHGPLREALADYLKVARSVVCDPEQILITHGIHQAIDLILCMLSDPGDAAWIEEPGYWGIRNLLNTSGLRVNAIPVDEEGLNPQPDDWNAPPRLVFVTPSHQYPTGAVMSLARRRALLEMARQHDRWVVEDDYDSEFRYGGRPLASLQGLDTAGRVLYVGTFSKTVFPSMRMGYMVLPKSLVEPFRVALSELYRAGHQLDQAILADFIAEGHFVAHIRRMRMLYGERRERLLDGIKSELGEGRVLSYDSQAGLHLVLELDGDDKAATEAARQAGLIVRPLSQYYQDPARSRNGLLLGYAGVPEKEIVPALQKLIRAIGIDR